jgi:hypothetical protein
LSWAETRKNFPLGPLPSHVRIVGSVPGLLMRTSSARAVPSGACPVSPQAIRRVSSGVPAGAAGKCRGDRRLRLTVLCKPGAPQAVLFGSRQCLWDPYVLDDAASLTDLRPKGRRGNRGMDYAVRRARTADVRAIRALVDANASSGRLLDKATSSRTCKSSGSLAPRKAKSLAAAHFM